MKQNISLITLALLLACGFAQAQTGIGTLAPDSSAALDITSVRRGFLPPRMTALQRNAIALPARGLVVYDTDSAALMLFNGVGWTRLLSTAQDKLWDKNGNHLFNTTVGNVGVGLSAPTAKLEVAHTSTPASAQLTLTETTAANYARLVLRNINQPDFWTIAGQNTGTPATDKLSFYHSTGGEVIQFNGAGNIGIGANAFPGSKITIDGGAATALTAAGNGNSLLNPVVNIANNGSSGIALNVTSVGNTGTAISAVSNGASGKALEVSGVDKAIIVTSGKSGFGITSPAEVVDVNGGVRIGNTSTTNAGTLRYNGTDFQGYTGGQWVTLSGNPVSSQWIQNGNNLTNANTGNIGIGANPAANAKLDVSSSLANTLNAVNTNASGAAVQATNATGAAGIFNTTSGTGVMINTTSPAAKALVISSGKSGFGILNPTEQVDVNGAVRIGSTTTANSGTIRFNGNDFEGYNGTGWRSFTDTGASFWTRTGTNVSNNNSGNVGIGTTTPQQALHVKGRVRIDTLANGAATDSVLTVDANGVLRRRNAAAFSGNNGWGLNGNTGTDSSNFIGTIDNQALRFKVNNQSAGIIDSLESNTALGYKSFHENAGGFNNTALGYKALLSNTTGIQNTALGLMTLAGNTQGGWNTAVGMNALVNNRVGERNTAVGFFSMLTNTSGSMNTVLGHYADVGDSALTNATAIGNRALVGASNSLVLGSIAGVNYAAENTKVGIGTTTPQQALHVKGRVRIDTLANGAATDSVLTVDANGVLRRRNAAAFSGNNGWGLNGNTGTDSSNFIGTIDSLPLRFRVKNRSAGIIDYADFNTALGLYALRSYQPNTNSFGNSAFGSEALYANTTGTYNTASGFQALASNTTGGNNTALGSQALLLNTTGGNNVSAGTMAISRNTTGSRNTATGDFSLLKNTTGNDNTALGRGALAKNKTGDKNTAIGMNADLGDSTLSNATAIGALARVDASNSLVLGSIAGVNYAAENTKVGIGTTMPQQALHVKGRVRIDTLANGAATDSVLTVDANGVLRRRNAAAFSGNNGPWTVNGNQIYNSNSGNTGIATNTPVAALNVGLNKTVLFGDDTLNTGVKMMWLPAKKAFRVGEISAGYDNWNPYKIGDYSFASGNNSLASGTYSAATGSAQATASYATGLGAALASGMYATAVGSSTASATYTTAGGAATASAIGATAFGEQTQATGAEAMAAGYYSVASGQFATAIGGRNYAEGFASTALGVGNRAKAYGGVVVGAFNDTSDMVSNPNAYTMTERVFQVANGYKQGLFTPAVQSNALTILRNGNTGIGVLNPTAKLDVAGNLKITDGTQGVGKVLTSDANGNASWQTPAGGSSGWGLNGNSGTSNMNFLGTTSAVDLTFKTNNETGLVLQSNGTLVATGSTVNGGAPNLGAGSRMMWIPALGAFRAGTVTGNHWNAINVGYYSTAMGYNAQAPGYGGVALGSDVAAGGQYSIALGKDATTGAANTVAIGHLVNANQPGAVIIGDQEYSNTLSASAMNQMSMRFKGGYRLFTSSSTTGGMALYAEYAPGGSSWSFVSDKRKKENFDPVNAESILQKAAALPVSTWNYIGYNDGKSRHYGPMAQDFFKAFGRDKHGAIGNDTTISSADFDAINLIAIQALEKRTQDLQDEINRLKAENSALKTYNTSLKDAHVALKADNSALQLKGADMEKRLSKIERLLDGNHALAQE